jgi:outer membrane protein TolC
MLAGCNVGPKYVPPTTTAPPAFKESPTQFKETEETNGWTVAQPQDATLRGKWWEIYNEPDLNALEEQLNVDNQNIREAFENLHGCAGAGAGSAGPVFSHGEQLARRTRVRRVRRRSAPGPSPAT